MSELDTLREQIDSLDKIIAEAYAKRLEVVKSIGEFKRKNNIKVLDSGREDIVYNNVTSYAPGYEKEVRDLYQYIMEYSKNKQSQKEL